MKKNRVLISGPDGTGKSTLTEAVYYALNSNGIKTNKRWLRFNHYLAKGVNFIGRLAGKSYYEVYSWGSIGYHNYEGVIGLVYIYAVYIDFMIFDIFIRPFVLKSKKYYLIDRFIIDVLADLIVDTKRDSLVIKLFRPLLLNELKESIAFIMTCNKEIVMERRPDIKDDKVWDRKHKAYELIADTFNIPMLNSGISDLDTLVEIVQNKIVLN